VTSRISGLAWLAALVVLSACSGSGDGREAVEDLAGDDITPEQTQCILDRVELAFGVPLDDLDGDLSPEQELSVAIARDVCLLDPDSAPPATVSPDAGVSLPPGLEDAAARFDPDDRPPGDDEELDALWLACGDGDAQACDALLFAAPPGSAYEAFGFSCGGRESLRCSTLLGESEVPDGLSPATPAPGTDSVFDGWWVECAGGSARACDQLMLTAPGGSDYYRFGSSCGGRAIGYCTLLLGDDGKPPILAQLGPDDPPPGDDELLDQLWVACGGRNAQACDDLYDVAPYGSPYERFAVSCGGRSVRPCETMFRDEDATAVEERQDAEVRGS
jgi:hypothetical protein